MSKNCQYCNQEFTKDRRTSRKHFLGLTKYCSLPCKQLAMRGCTPVNKAQVEITCEVCQHSFMVSPYRRDSAKFCSRNCLGRSRAGNKSPHWQGGITALSKAIRNSDQYKEWRTAVFERDNFTCVKCDEGGAKLEADHIQLFSRYPDLRFELSNGQTLCRDCHKAKTGQDLKLHWSNQFARSA